MQFFVKIVIVFFILIVWMWVPKDEMDEIEDKFSVTITYDCRDIADDDEIPEEVSDECDKVMKDVKNETRAN